jgi:hypothetical protein
MPEHGYECPLCDLTSTERNEIYAHLMTSHRKSAISDALLKTTGMRIESPESSPRTPGAESVAEGPEREERRADDRSPRSRGRAEGQSTEDRRAR